MGGHTTPAVGGIYWALNGDRPTVETEAQLTSNPNSILFPTTGVDVNRWVECSDLSPDRTGQVVIA